MKHNWFECDPDTEEATSIDAAFVSAVRKTKKYPNGCEIVVDGQVYIFKNSNYDAMRIRFGFIRNEEVVI